MVLLKLAFASAVAYGVFRYVNRERPLRRAAFAAGESTAGAVEVRNAGPDSMRSDLPEWDKVDQASDESYPASDPPASNRFT
ncbi:hypothetical protein KRR38_22165 [Novosphingobium sp. G106]|uniref:hypothetical protein n=1 Tax=Novosphingobium sp. G106 TaxID=2849500 RepID=UPI001C2D8AE3|nr:hypothetical protein [Novosphingobium sp. G106]MBV1690313.1 hypothetical protein [Novosphingobium sp. G106]